MKSVSIVTVCFNSEKTIRDTIVSVLNQTVAPKEYLIIDGLSKDNTVAVAKEYEEQFLKKGIDYKIISEKDNGIYDAMNKGIDLATGDIIGIINSDDWFENIAVETVVNTYEETPFDMFYADLNLLKENGTVIVKHSKFDKYPTTRHWNHPTSFITKATYNSIGKYRCEGLYDDFDFMLRVKKAGLKVVIKNIVLANFRVGGVSTGKSIKACINRVKDRYRCYTNNKYSKLYGIECLAIETAKLIIS